ncbi:MAG: DNA alkylation repair protein [Bacteroidota bacterium]
MPAIDLSRLRKQAARLTDFFFLPEEFLKHLHELLDYYVNRSLRQVEDVAPGSILSTYHTPSVVIRQIELELGDMASENPSEALDLADLLWDQGYLEMHMLAAFLLGRIPPLEAQGQRLLARLTAWSAQVRDPNVRASLLSTSLARLRRETPGRFLQLIGEWLHPARTRTWSNGIQALLPLIADPDFQNLPAVLDLVEPVVEAAPALIQLDLEELIVALYKASPEETSFFLRQVLTRSENPMTAITLRRISSSFPVELQSDLRGLLRNPKNLSAKGG